eukprot:comp20420_c0_seq1/m.25896 comp20420_c0_seq1/g.25896  ORF comp20420_c0_seq1/g.25896 comp20420_c0_seq1/m.25896 type:complete len:295 (-) comp20420_c0_seq1:423-1307(-)
MSVLTLLRPAARTVRAAAKVNLAGCVWRGYATAQTQVLSERLDAANAGVAVLTLNRPEAKNALGKEFLGQLRAAMDDLRFDPSVRVVILRSSVERVFCAGADLKERAKMSPPEVAAFVHQLRSAFSELETLPMPTIAAVDGAALGGGLEMALACDMRVAGSGAKLGLPETRLAIIPGAGGTQRLPRIIGVAKAKELIYTARVLTGPEAEKIGLVNYAVHGDPFPRALELAQEILPSGPVALRMAKIAIDQGSEVERGAGMMLEQACYAQVIPTKDRLEGLAAFREKRKPVYVGH